MKQIIIYFGLAYLISWTIWFPLYGHIFGLTNLRTIPFNHAIGGLGPSIAAFITTWVFLGVDGVKKLLAACLQMRPVAYLIIALLSPFFILCLATYISCLFNGTTINLSGLLRSREFPHWNLIAIFIYSLVFFGMGEEIGWRGFALPWLQNKSTPLRASLILAVFWALWHLPLFFYRPGFTNMEFAGMAGWLVSILTGSVLLTWLFNATGGSIFICAVFHSTIDIAFTANVADEKIIGYMGALITIWGILTIVLLKTKNAEMQKVTTNAS